MIDFTLNSYIVIMSVTDLLCEPAYFATINSLAALREQGAACSASATLSDLHPPALDTTRDECHVQGEPLLFSCVGAHSGLRRLCPCRTFTRGQWALCQGCQ